ncbi:MAG TPA: LOG family protein [Anaerolineales bacterium]|nr:LOG family protein [Anaerolineales bacterium]HMV96137.1 LOG family protein [Anaerolineales bacterium]HMX17975.1 LOG family protein [Anaerolineales bacterium]HMX73038.1 LOG family protein [Anaerolineales bacterium]HMZ41692.1 LOG family protein [Anaerolineales bacterium]
MNITVFGGAQPKEGSQAYEEARELGSLLAQRGHAVLTGGYMGTMEAVSRGAHEAGGHVIGVTCIDIEEWRNSKPNQWVKEERRRQTLMERLMGLIEGCDAAMALSGGAGTLTEISLMWNLMIVESLPPRPLILVGSGWQSTFDQFFREFESYMPKHQRELLYFAKDVKTAVTILQS